jgi:RNA polymerase sigma-70 factor (ECF subfamily)
MSSLDLLERILRVAALFAPDDEAGADPAASAGARARESEGLKRALISHHHYLLALLRYKAGDEELAEDILQETYLAFLASRPDARRFADESKLKNYLVTIALNKLRDHWRREGGARRHRQLFRSREEAEAWLESLPSTEADPEGSLLDSEEGLRLRRAVALAMEGLGERQRLALEMKFARGLDNASIAGELGLGIKAVESLLFRAKAQFRARFGETAVDANERPSGRVHYLRDAGYGSKERD